MFHEFVVLKVASVNSISQLWIMLAINKLFVSSLSDSAQGRRGSYFQARYLSLGKTRVLILGKYVLLGSETQFMKNVTLERFCEMQVKDQFLYHRTYISALERMMKLILFSCVLLVHVFINGICKHYYT